jgi:hypothetical protein
MNKIPASDTQEFTLSVIESIRSWSSVSPILHATSKKRKGEIKEYNYSMKNAYRRRTGAACVRYRSSKKLAKREKDEKEGLAMDKSLLQTTVCEVLPIKG